MYRIKDWQCKLRYLEYYSLYLDLTMSNSVIPSGASANPILNEILSLFFFFSSLAMVPMLYEDIVCRGVHPQ